MKKIKNAEVTQKFIGGKHGKTNSTSRKDYT